MDVMYKLFFPCAVAPPRVCDESSSVEMFPTLLTQRAIAGIDSGVSDADTRCSPRVDSYLPMSPLTVLFNVTPVVYVALAFGALALWAVWTRLRSLAWAPLPSSSQHMVVTQLYIYPVK